VIDAGISLTFSVLLLVSRGCFRLPALGPLGILPLTPAGNPLPGYTTPVAARHEPSINRVYTSLVS